MWENEIHSLLQNSSRKISRRNFIKWFSFFSFGLASPKAFGAPWNYSSNPDPLKRIEIKQKEKHYKFAFPINGSETRTLELLNFLTHFNQEENKLRLGFITGDIPRKEYLKGIDKKIEKMSFPEFKDRFIPFNYNSTPIIVVCPENVGIKDIQQRAVLVKQGRIFTSDIEESKKTKIYDWIFKFGSEAVEKVIKKAGPLPTLAFELLKIKGPKDDQERWEGAVSKILEGISSQKSKDNYYYIKINPIAHPQELLTTEIGRQYLIQFDARDIEQKNAKSFIITRPSVGPTTDFSGVSHISHLERMLWGDFEIKNPFGKAKSKAKKKFPENLWEFEEGKDFNWIQKKLINGERPHLWIKEKIGQSEEIKKLRKADIWGVNGREIIAITHDKGLLDGLSFHGRTLITNRYALKNKFIEDDYTLFSGERSLEEIKRKYILSDFSFNIGKVKDGRILIELEGDREFRINWAGNSFAGWELLIGENPYSLTIPLEQTKWVGDKRIPNLNRKRIITDSKLEVPSFIIQRCPRKKDRFGRELKGKALMENNWDYENKFIYGTLDVLKERNKYAFKEISSIWHQ
ncbi:hypothetical protein K9L16_00465 [Candidatus Pacearchaeota archaeon]|nr:hypothetical protein [Candidatus Pacearchaeota archaeon]